MSIEEITIKQVKPPFGFARHPEVTSYQGVIFGNGKVAYLDEHEDICVADDEKTLVKSLKPGSIEVQIIHKGGA